jgi:ABC-type transport system involved in multi-copper enzyme maturation permease subunit
VNASAVIDRELRVAARQPFTYWLRTAGVAALLVVCGYAVLTATAEIKGAEFFSFIHLVIFIAIWVIVPLLTADSISSERREGTLPLLFLSRLTARQIVAAKGVAHALRALTLWGAALPVAAIAFLIGGLTWKEAVISVCINLGSILFALSAGLAASSLCRRWGRAMAGAAMLSVLFLFIFIFGNALVVEFSVAPFMPRATPENVSLRELIEFTTDADGLWSMGLASMSRIAQLAWVGAELLMALLSVLWFFAVFRYAAWRIAGNWQHRAKSRAVEKAEAVFCRPMFAKAFLARWLQRTLERNPVGWLERRTWSGRMITWIWCAVLALIYSVVSSTALSDPAFVTIQSFLVYLLIISVAASAAGSFRRERETGVMELLLVSPIKEINLIGGRLRALWMQFAPAFALLFGVWLWWGSFQNNGRLPLLVRIAGFAVIFVTCPVIGLYFSLARKSFISAFLWTFVFGGLLPIFFQAIYALGYFPGRFLWRIWGYIPRWQDNYKGELGCMIFQMILALVFGSMLYENLRRRRFATPGSSNN